jgi:predicted DCC family thiol-disulfide oxidoreductase YuxK
VLTVLYDERCGFCTAVARWLARFGRELDVAPIGSPAGERLLGDLAPADRYAAVHAVDETGRRSTGGAAVPPVLARLPGGRLPARAAAAVPGATERGYALVARHRGTLSRLLRQNRS